MIYTISWFLICPNLGALRGLDKLLGSEDALRNDAKKLSVRQLPDEYAVV